MTSAVKQSLPPVLLPKAGLEGKGARSRAPQADFAEALGIGKKSPSGHMKPASDDAGPAPTWPRLATRFGGAAEHIQNERQEVETAAVVPGDEADEKTGDDKPASMDPRDRADERGATDAPQPNTFRLPVTGIEAPIFKRVEDSRTAPQADAAKDADFVDINSHAEIASTLQRFAGQNADDGETASPASPPARAVETPSSHLSLPMRAGARAEPQQIEGTTGPAPSAGGSRAMPFARDAMQEIAPERAPEPARSAPRATVVGQQNIPAPMQSTAVTLVQSIVSGDLLAAPGAATTPNAIHAAATHVSAQSLKIQLHPAELGMITATLRFAGERLSIELQVENHDAYHRLASDSDAIVGSLRDLGYEIDKVTVLQSAIASSPAVRSESLPAGSLQPARSSDQFNSAMSNGGNAGSGERSTGNGGKQGHGSQQGAPSRLETVDGDLYI